MSDTAKKNHRITTIVMESVGWVHKTIEMDHAAGWLPGQLLFGLVGGAGTANTLLAKAILVEKDLIGETVHDTYDENEALLVWFAQPADRAALRLKDDTSVEENDFVVPADAPGTVEKYVAGTHAASSIIGMAAEDLDLTGNNQGNINLVEVLLV